MTALTSYSAPLGRVFLALIFIVSGLGKLSAYAGTQAYMESAGVPGALLPAMIRLPVGSKRTTCTGAEKPVR